jgi:hypothetical protein
MLGLCVVHDDTQQSFKMIDIDITPPCNVSMYVINANVPKDTCKKGLHVCLQHLDMNMWLSLLMYVRNATSFV